MIIKEKKHQNIVWAKDENAKAIAFVVQSSSQFYNTNTARTFSSLDKQTYTNYCKLGYEKKDCFS